MTHVDIGILPEKFQTENLLEIFWTHFPKVLVGKNKCLFPFNVLKMYQNSRYVRTLLEATNVKDFTKIQFLSDLEISYDDEAFWDLWIRYNLDGTPLFEKIDLQLIENKIPYLIKLWTYSCYFGFPLITELERELVMTDPASITDSETKSLARQITKKYFSENFKKDLVNCINEVFTNVYDLRYVFYPANVAYLKLVEKLYSELGLPGDFRQIFLQHLTKSAYMAVFNPKPNGTESKEAIWLKTHRYLFPDISDENYRKVQGAGAFVGNTWWV